ncbi:Gfo/Idh/MocA family oxidoreductase [Gramella sp. GC03-9]|uniref:Gfo/Idh/MocA family oxidoreductase n=1 Tax=Christiangramia oceanisediminis TaxID=2920386 RepID=A0A9X2KYR5_9FLAO|nr:Gfo/Idh/MocA family oxidoreductase [Gramella oceanisediminis]MCP9200699.1 Gfo/Idh/MocA family oxidoreductase [Gramella oceanisediminis]
MSRKIKWGIVGLGKIAGKFAEGLKHVENAQLYAVASRDLAKAEEFSEKHNSEIAYGSYEQLMEDPEVEVIYVATPHSLHERISIQCLNHGKAVLCEKPFAINLEQAKKMINLAREKDIFLMEAMWTMFLPHFQHVLELVNSGKYGKVKKIKADFGFKAEFDASKRLFNKSLGGGSLLDIGIYPVFLAYAILGYPEKIEASSHFAETGVDTSSEIRFSYSSQAEAELYSTLAEKTPTTGEVQLEKAVIKINSRFHEPSSLTVITDGKEEHIKFENIGNGYNYEAAHVTRMLLEHKTESDKMDFTKTLDLMKLLDDIREKTGLVY